MVTKRQRKLFVIIEIFLKMSQGSVNLIGLPDA